MNRPWKAGIAVLLMCILFLYGCTGETQTFENTKSPQQLETSAPTAATTEATTVPEETTEPQPVWLEPDFSLASSHVFVYHTASDTMIFSKGELQGRIAPASLTKLYSAWVALQYLTPEDVITAGSEVTLIDPESSVAYIYQGQKLTVEMCVEGMLLQSGNDAAYVLAVAAGRAISGNPALSATAAIGIFAGKMNELALANGLENTHFSNPDGIDAPGHYTSLEDLIKISHLAMENPIIRKYSAMATDNVTYASGETASWKNTNELLHPASQFYCEAAVGLKTGSTQNAGKCLISAFATEEGYLIIGTLGGKENYDRYIDSLNLYHHFTGQPLEEYEIEPPEGA